MQTKLQTPNRGEQIENKKKKVSFGNELHHEYTGGQVPLSNIAVQYFQLSHLHLTSVLFDQTMLSLKLSTQLRILKTSIKPIIQQSDHWALGI
jgi:hypothetical protein